MGCFEEDLAVGARGVALARARLAELWPAAPTVDLQAHRRWQRLGVDLLWRTPVRTVALEVKVERRETGNLVLETLSTAARRSPGWWITSHAHLVVYGFLDTGRWWLLHLPRLRRAIRDAVFLGLRSVRARTHGSHTTWCRLLPYEIARSTGGLAELNGRVPRGFLEDAPDQEGVRWDRALPPKHSCMARRCRPCGGGAPAERVRA